MAPACFDRAPHHRELNIDEQALTIVRFDERFAAAFVRLNRSWLEQHGLLEDHDLHQIEHPREAILADGGEIFVAVEHGEAVGTCATIRRDARTVELAKLAVAESARGRGLSRKLTQTAIDWAKQAGARRLVLVSSSKLAAALRLYDSLGFRRVTVPADNVYATADVAMELDL